jgi:hypothetical protein
MIPVSRRAPIPVTSGVGDRVWTANVQVGKDIVAFAIGPLRIRNSRTRVYNRDGSVCDNRHRLDRLRCRQSTPWPLAHGLEMPETLRMRSPASIPREIEYKSS